jgi:chromosome partitioning protein
MTRTIAISNQKGGTAKSTTTITLGAELARLGKRTLLVDLDPQGHLAEGFGLQSLGLEHDLSEVLEGSLPLAELIQPMRPNLFLAPANIHLAHLEPFLITKARREDRLKNALAPVADQYDVILIDCPPSLGILTINAFSAAQETLVPMATEFFALIGVGLLFETLQEIRAEINPELKVTGIVPTRMTHTRHAQEVIDQVRGELDGVRFFDSIPEAVAVRDAAAAGVPVTEYQPKSPAAEAYRRLAKDVLR